ncbi:amidohydrolase [Caldimonas sp. KR1-144]|uniref:amidohydrolase n=1 Tax=Caldimonas sp. KR1-144 TaxID=3400911 RepID=UPI003BFC9B7E
MKRSTWAWAGTIAAAAVALVAGCGGDGVEPATMVLRGGKVHTMDAQRTVAGAIAIRGERIVAVGDDASVRPYIGRDTEVIELDGRMVLPGFIDAHIHSALGSLELGKCSLDDAALTVEQIRAAVQACVAAAGSAETDQWFEVVNVNPAGLVMNKADLDLMLANRPLLLRGSDHHTAWVNTLGLQLAGIDASTPDPAGGQIERDAQGNPTGFLKDPPAIELAAAAIPAPTLVQRVEKAKLALAQHNAFGITSIQDPLATPDVLEVYAALEQQQALSVRVRAALASIVADDEAEYARLRALRDQYASGHPRLRADSVKVFADGVIEFPTQTAAVLKPYLDGHGQPTTNYGGRYFEQPVLNRYVERLDKEGFTVHVHAIGDATARGALDAFQHARERNGASTRRHQITHLQLVDPADFARFAQLDVIANMQLLWAIPDVYTIDALKPYIDAASFRYMYPAASLRNAGALLVGSSDWPVSTENPLLAIQTGVLRTNPENGLVLNAEERVTLDDMLAAYTINAAKALQQDANTGSLEAGKQADVIVLDRDLTAIAPEQIHEASVQLTLLDGRRAFDAAIADAARLVAREKASSRSATLRRGAHLHGPHRD